MILLLLAAAQAAQPVPPAPAGTGQPPATMVVEPVAMMFAGFDANGDGIVTRAEAIAGIRRSFATAAPDAAGTIGYIGYGDWALRWLGDSNALPSPFTLDTDGDNRISAAELEAGLLKIFDRLDANHDGQLSHAELLTLRATAGGDRDRRGRRR